jgi:hypothetical protein
MKKSLLFIFALSTGIASAQNYLHQALILNEGYQDYTTGQIVVPVTVGSYNPVTQQYLSVDTLNGMRFASDLIIDQGYYYVAADTKIFKFDLNTHAQIASVDCPGVRNLAVYQDKLIATRGEYLTTYDSYLHVYNTNDLSLVHAFTASEGPQWASQNIVVDGSIAYIAVNNGFDWGNEVGIIGKLDMNTLLYGNEIDLGPDGKNPDNLLKVGSFIYSVNNKDWSGSSVSKIAMDGSSNSTMNLATASTGCGTSALRDDKLVYQISMETTLNEFDINIMNNVGPISGHSTNYYELAQEPVSGNLFASETDFFSFGKVHIFDASNSEVALFTTGVSPGTIVFDIRPSAAGMGDNELSFGVYPNPTEGQFTVSNVKEGDYLITDVAGKVVSSGKVFENQKIDVSDLLKGYYFVNVSNGTSAGVQKILVN